MRSQFQPVTFVHQSDLAALQDLISKWDSRIFYLDGSALEDQTTFMVQAKADLPIGEGLFPQSWDGFIDAMWWGLSALEGEPTKIDIVWTNAHKLLQTGLHYFFPALIAFQEVARQVCNTENGFPREVSLKFFVVGDGLNFARLHAYL